MSYTDGIAAINLQPTNRIPRTECANVHWALMKAVTGVDVEQSSSDDEKAYAKEHFFRKWNYDFYTQGFIPIDEMKKKRTKMGHAVFMAGGVDFDKEKSCPFQSTEEVLAFDPVEVYGKPNKKELVLWINSKFNESQKFYPDLVNAFGTYFTCVSGLIEIFGWDMLLTACGEDPKGFGHVARRYSDFLVPYIEALAESDFEAIQVHDDICWTEGQIFNREWYETFVFPSLRRVITPLTEAGKKVIYVSDGTYQMFFDDIVKLGVHGFFFEPTNDLAEAAERYGKTHAIFGGPDTRVLLFGDKNDIYREVKRCMDIGRSCPGYFMCVVNHIPPNTPVDNCLFYNEYYEKLSKR